MRRREVAAHYARRLRYYYANQIAEAEAALSIALGDGILN